MSILESQTVVKKATPSVWLTAGQDHAEIACLSGAHGSRLSNRLEFQHGV